MEEQFLLWQGCVYLNKLQSLREEMFQLLKRLKIKFVTLKDEECCGYPLTLVGYTDQATTFAKQVIKKLDDANLVVANLQVDVVKQFPCVIDISGDTIPSISE